MSTDPTFQKQGPLMNSNELALFDLLTKAVGPEYLIMPQVHLEKLIDPIRWKGDKKYAVGHVSRWSVDFALFDSKTWQPALAIELNGDSHNNPDKIKRDDEVKHHLSEAGIPLLTFRNHKLPTSEELLGAIHAKLQIK